MKRKLLNGLLLLAVATGGVGTFTSCKDDEGITNRSEVIQKSLADQIAAIRGITDPTFRQNLDKWLDEAIKNASAGNQYSYDSLIDLLKAVSDVTGRVDALEIRCNALQAAIDEETAARMAADAVLQAEIDALGESLGNLQGRVAALEAWQVDINNWVEEINAWQTKIENWQKEIGDWQKYIEDWKGDIESWQTQVNKDLADVIAQAAANKEAIENLSEKLDQYKTELDALQAKVEGLEGRVEQIESNVETLQGQVEELQNQYSQLLSKIAEINTEIEALKEVDAQLQAQINEFNGKISAIYNFLAQKFAQFITGLEVHQTFNPIFGTINLPIGIQSTVVGAYFYNSTHDINFPSYDNPSWEYGENDPATMKSTLENIANILQPERVSLKGNTPYVAEGNNNMGEIYLSVNPRNINYNGLQVSLVNSQDEEILKASNLKLEIDNETILDHGITKAEENHSLYRLPVGIQNNWEDINQIAFSIENKKELVEAFKSAIKEHNVGDFAHLGKLLYEHLDGFLPAYAIRVSWDDPQVDANGNVTTVTNSVYSKFNLAATVAHPLSYATGWGFSIDKQLPLFDPITEYAERLVNKLRSEVNSIFNGIEFTPIKSDLSNAKISVSEINGDIIVEVGGCPVYNATTGEPMGNFADGTQIIFSNNGLGEFEFDFNVNMALLQNLAAIANTSIDAIEKDIQDGIDQVIDQLNAQVVELQGNINQKLDDLLKRIDEAKSGKLRYADKLVDLYNKLATRVNSFLKDPNHYLQSAMAYNAGDGLHHLSSNVMSPTVFTQGGGNAIELFATSYNAEIIVPAYKKYVAITNVYYPFGEEIPDGGFNLFDLNKAAGLNKVLEGRQQRVAINVENNRYFQPGYVYEVYYTALDYRGFTSSRKYFFTIK